MTTYHPTLQDVDKKREWLIIDAEGIVLGQLATKVASILRGKDKVIWLPSTDCGDYVVVINAEKVVLTGNKDEVKVYIHHTGFPGGIKEKTAGKMRLEHPERIIESAVHGMIPRNRLRKHMLERLKVYAGSKHPHEQQKLKTITLK